MTKTLSEFFSTDDLQSIDPNNIPRHIAIIPDGNRRWAKAKFLQANLGHIAGAENGIRIAQAAKDLGIKTLTIYAFSTENWKRPKPEVDNLLQTIEDYIVRYQQKLVDNGVRFQMIGRADGLSPNLKTILQKTQERTKDGANFELVVAINYGGRDEIVRALQQICKTNIDPTDISEHLISQFLDTKGLCDPDLIIRTSGEMRLSNFLLWQSSYSELYCSPISWPDFTPQHLLDAVKSYQMRVRRIGGNIA